MNHSDYVEIGAQMRSILFGHVLYVSISVSIFLWVLSYPNVNIADFQRPFIEYSGIIFGMIVCVAFALLLSFMAKELTNRDPQRETSGLISRIQIHHCLGYLAHIAPPIVAFVVTMSSFAVHKAIVLPTFGYSWDMQFVAWDRWLFGGVDPWQITHGVFSSPQATWFLDQLYHNWFYPMFILYALCAMMVRAPEVRVCYIGTYLMSWLLIGVIMAGVFVSAGPAYDGVMFESGGKYFTLIERLTVQAEAVGGLDALAFQDMLYQGYLKGVASVGYGISAMPSMHIALATMWMLLFFNLNRWLGIVGVFYVLLIWVGSVHLGWHYAVDGVLSFIVVLAIWFSIRAALHMINQPQIQAELPDAAEALTAQTR